MLQFGFSPKKAMLINQMPNGKLSWGFTRYFSFFKFLLYTHKGNYIFEPQHRIQRQKLHKYGNFEQRRWLKLKNVQRSLCVHQRVHPAWFIFKSVQLPDTVLNGSLFDIGIRHLQGHLYVLKVFLLTIISFIFPFGSL